MNPPDVLRLLALLWVAAAMARRCERRSTALPKPILEESSIQIKECGKTTPQRIVGGVEAAPKSSPWTVALSYENRMTDVEKLFCGGSLVTERHVVTAGHCVVDRPTGIVFEPSVITVFLQEQNLPGLYESGDVESVWLHEGYILKPNFTSNNDIAVLVLVKPVEFGVTAAPVCLPYALREVDLTGREAVVVGWGYLKTGGPSPENLQALNVTITDLKKCQQVYSITSDQFCAGNTADPTKDTCTGDSGGPLVTAGPDDRMNLVGVVADGGYVENGLTICGDPDYLGTYTNVTMFLDWIVARLRGLPPPKPSFV